MKVRLPFRYAEDGVIDIYIYIYKTILLPIIIVMGTKSCWRKEKQTERKTIIKQILQRLKKKEKTK